MKAREKFNKHKRRSYKSRAKALAGFSFSKRERGSIGKLHLGNLANRQRWFRTTR